MRLVVTRDDYFAAALDVLATRGHARLKIGTLCSSIGVTTGSFYHYFGNWDGFVQALLEHWEQEKTQRIFAIAAAQKDPLARVGKAKTLTLTLPHGAETAIRAWSHVNPAVETVQRRVDEERLQALCTIVRGVISDPREAELLAVMGLSLLIGLQQWRTPVDPKELQRLLDGYEALILSRAQALAG